MIIPHSMFDEKTTLIYFICNERLIYLQCKNALNEYRTYTVSNYSKNVDGISIFKKSTAKEYYVFSLLYNLKYTTSLPSITAYPQMRCYHQYSWIPPK